MKGFAQRLILKERYKVALKWPITFSFKFKDLLCEEVVCFVADCKQI